MAARSFTRTVRATDRVEAFLDGYWTRLPDPAGFTVVETEGEPFRLVYLGTAHVPAPWRVTAHGLWRIEELGDSLDSTLLASLQSFQPEIAVSGENGGGGNRTRVTSQPGAPPEQADRVSDASGEPRPRLCNTGADA